MCPGQMFIAGQKTQIKTMQREKYLTDLIEQILLWD